MTTGHFAGIIRSNGVKRKVITVQIERQIASVMGGNKVLHHQINGAVDFDFVIRKGLPWEAAICVKETLRMTDAEFSQNLGISVRTLSRSKTTGRMTVMTGDRLYRLARIYAFAKDVLEDAQAAIRWLHNKQIGLGGRTPLEMIETEVGGREVENLLGRIEHGVLA